jgi:3-deoxy-7-phosphoheptulonate synthase
MSTSRESGNTVLSLKDFFMMERIDNRNVIDIGPLITPRKVKEKLPLTDSAESIVMKTRQSIQEILHGRELTGK